MKIVTEFLMLSKKQFSQRKLSHSISFSDKASLKLLNSSENGKKTSFDSKRHHFAVSFLKNF